MLKFIFKIYIFLFTFLVFAQEKPKDSLPVKTDKYGLRLGVDLYKLSRSFYDKEYKGLELVGDFRLTKKHYVAAEIGNENKTTSETYLNFTTKGSYIKAGFDYNTYENWTGMNNLIHLGFRYGFSSFNQTLNSYSIYNTNHYFNTVTNYPTTKYDGLTASWIEIASGIKVEIFNNLFIGTSVRLNYLLSNKTPETFDNLYIPGYNKTYNGKFGVSFNYTISYFLPIFKKKVVAKTQKK